MLQRQLNIIGVFQSASHPSQDVMHFLYMRLRSLLSQHPERSDRLGLQQCWTQASDHDATFVNLVPAICVQQQGIHLLILSYV